MRTLTLAAAAALFLLGAQTASAAACAGGEPDIQNPVPNCGVQAPAPRSLLQDGTLHEGRSSAVLRRGRHAIGEQR